MQIKRLFTTTEVKGTENYLNSQKKYEVARTLIYFAVSITLFIAGYVQTKTRVNLLTLVAVLGCLPASKSAVNAIMFLRFKSCSSEIAAEIKAHKGAAEGLFDCVFTSYKKNFCISHIAVRDKTICGFTEDSSFEENEFYKHIQGILKLDGHKDITVKIFTNLSKYTERLEQLQNLEEHPAQTQSILQTLKSVML